MTAATQNQSGDWLESLTRKQKQTANILFAATGLCAVIALYIAYRYKTEYLPVSIWAVLTGLICLGGGAARLLFEPRDLSPRDVTRFIILAVGGLIGLVTAVCLGGGLGLRWSQTIAGGWTEWQGKEGWQVWAVLLIVIVGLGLIFVSLQLGRSDAQSSSLYRRLVYACNAFFTACLLFMILLIVNVLISIPSGAFAFFSTTHNWASAAIYSLSQQSENILQGLDKPLKVYVLLPKSDPWYDAVKMLMENCRGVNKGLQVKYLSPDLEREEVDKLSKDYKFGNERRGLLLVYGTEPDTESRFIKYTDIGEQSMDFSGRRQREGSFKGESALISEVKSLTEGKDKPIIYFTQGNGELDLADSSSTELDKGLGQLKQRLEGANYKVKGLQFTLAEGAKSPNPDIAMASRVPDDAGIVVIAGPREPLPPPALAALREYMSPADPAKKKGKMVVLFDVYLTPEKTMQQTGLENLMAEFGVRVGNDIIYHDSRIDPNQLPPFQVAVMLNPDESVRNRNQLVASFEPLLIPLVRVRSVQPLPPGAPDSNRFRVDPIMVVHQRWGIWAETNLSADSIAILNEYIKRAELAKKLSDTNIPVAVAVNETSPAVPGNPHAFMDEKPRMLVFGDATWVGNRLMSPRANPTYHDLFASSLAWLREKPASIGIEAKKRDTYSLSPDANVSRMVWLPAIFMFVGIIGLGAGVWVVRRR